MSDLWSNLTVPQQIYLLAIYEIDQEKEQEEREYFRHHGRTRPASEWRWIEYATLEGKHSSLKKEICHLGLQQPAIAALFEELQQKGLILWKYALADRNNLSSVQGEAMIAIQMTRPGRKLVRQAPGHQPKLQPLTENQQAYADKIVEAGLAPREEVEAAFRDKSAKGRERIRGWGENLSHQVHQDHDGLAQGTVTSAKKKHPLYLPKGEDNPYMAWQYTLMTSAELLGLLPFWKFSVRRLNPIAGKWTEEARCCSRESAYQITKALHAQEPRRYYVVIHCLRIGKEGREKPVLFAPSEGAVELAMYEAREKRDR